MSDHDELLDRLKQMTRLAEAPPPKVLHQALEAFSWRSVSSSLASIDYDSALDEDDSARVRAGAQDRRLSFRGSRGHLEVSVVDGGARMVGRVEPVGAGVVLLRYPTRTDSTVPDRFGHFVFESIEPGPVSFYWQPEDGESGFDTEWVMI